MASVKHKVDQENSQFKSGWTEEFCFILSNHANAKPICLICTQTVTVSKAENLKRHFSTMHAVSFNANYPTKSDQRKRKIANMLTSYKQSVSTMNKSTTAQESAIAASLQVSWTLTRAKKPFPDAELIKKCAVEMATSFKSWWEKEESHGRAVKAGTTVGQHSNHKSRSFSGIFFPVFSSIWREQKPYYSP